MVIYSCLLEHCTLSIICLCRDAVDPDLVVVVEVVGLRRPAAGDDVPGPRVVEKDPVLLAPVEEGTDRGDEVAEGGVEVHVGDAGGVVHGADQRGCAQEEDAHGGPGACYIDSDERLELQLLGGRELGHLSETRGLGTADDGLEEGDAGSAWQGLGAGEVHEVEVVVGLGDVGDDGCELEDFLGHAWRGW